MVPLVIAPNVPHATFLLPPLTEVPCNAWRDRKQTVEERFETWIITADFPHWCAAPPGRSSSAMKVVMHLYDDDDPGLLDLVMRISAHRIAIGPIL